jgi:hypothetical protein
MTRPPKIIVITGIDQAPPISCRSAGLGADATLTKPTKHLLDAMTTARRASS